MSIPSIIEVEAALGKRSLAEFVKICWKEVDPADLVWEPHLDQVCQHLEALFYHDISRLVINIPPGLSKPVWVGEKVLTPQGEKRLKDVEVGDLVLTHKGRFRQVTALHEQGRLPALKITSFSGREIIAAPDHPFLTPTGWKKAQDLSDKDSLAVVQAPESGSSTMSPEEARFLGYMVGDGCCKNMPMFTQADERTMDDFIHCARTIGLDPSEIKSKPGCPNVKFVTIRGGRPSKTKKLLERHGLLDKDSYGKRIPEAVMKGDAEVIGNFLGAYWSCDGHIKVRHRRDARSTHIAKLSTVGKNLAQDVQRAAWQIGIHLRIRTKEVNLKTRRQGDTYTSYDVMATDTDQVAAVASLPGLSDAKRNNTEGVCRSDFDRPLRADRVISVEPFDTVACRCLTVYEDESFTVQGVAVHNSIITNVFFPAWCWAVDPTFRIAFIGNDLPLARRDARKCRQLIEGKFYQDRWPLKLTDDSNRIEEFTNEKAGVRQCFTIRQQITGHHFHCICIDDPHKPQAFNVGDGTTEAVAAAQTYDEVLPTRFIDQKKPRLVLIMQRLAENDLAGHILEHEEDVEHLCLPMEFVPARRCETSIGGDWRVYEGELLAPKRFPREVVERLKKGFHSPRIASAQFQQDPIPNDGIIFRAKYFENRYTELPEKLIYYLSFDFSFKETDTSDYVVGTVWGVGGRLIHLVDMIRGRWGFTDTLRQTLTLAEKYSMYRAMLIEEKANGAAIIDALKASHHGRKVMPVNPGRTTKVERAFACTPLMENKTVLFPKREPHWWSDYYKELLHFPSGRNDDIVDSTTQALLYMGVTQIPDMTKVLSNMRRVLPPQNHDQRYR